MADEKISETPVETTIVATDLLPMVDSATATTKHITGANHKTATLGELENLTDAEIQQVENIGTTTISAAQWVYLGSMDQGVVTTDTVEFADVKITGFTEGSILFVGAAGLIVQDNPVLNWEDLNRRLVLGGIVPTGENTITAGEDNAIVSGSNNDITGANSDTAVILGGSGNTITNAKRAIILGGTTNTASGDYSLVGAWMNAGSGDYSVSLGGQNSVASGSRSVTLGGNNNAAAGTNSYAMGTQSKANHNGCFVISDLTAANLTTSAINQFLTRYSGGHRLTGGGLTVDTLNTVGGILQTDGSGVFSTSVTLPDGTLVTTQSPADNSTKAASTAYVDAAVGGEDLWDRVTGTPNYLIPATVADDVGGTGARITKGWFTDIDATNIRGSGPAFEFGPVRSDADGDLSVGRINLADGGSEVKNILTQNNGGTGFTINYSDGQLLIGQTSGGGLNRTTLTGTANQVTVTNGSGTITLSLPQDLATSSSPTFAGGTFTDNVSISASSSPVTRTTRTSSETATTQTACAIQHSTSGDAADDFGVALSFEMTDSGVSNSGLGFIHAIRDGADNTGKMLLGPRSTGGFVYSLTLEKSGKVGVGTLNPSATLDVTDSTGTAVSLYVGDDNLTTNAAFMKIGQARTGDGLAYVDLIGDTTYTGFGSRWLRQATANGNTTFLHKGTGGFIIEAQNAGYIALNTSGLERMRILSSGEIGIGTPTPDASSLVELLSANKGFLPPRLTSTARDAISSPAEGLLVYDSTNHKPDVYNGTAWKAFVLTDVSTFVPGGIVFATGPHEINDDSNLFWDNTNKRLGIGTNSPDVGLEVSGTTMGQAALRTTGITVPGTLDLLRKNGTEASPTPVLDDDILSYVLFRGYDSVGEVDEGVRFTVTATENWTAGSHGAKLEIGTVPNGSSTASTRIIIEDGGNVGIGATDAFYRLTVVDNSGINGPTLGLKRDDAVVAADNRIGRVAMMGGESNPDVIVGSIVVDAEADWTVTSSPTRMEFRTTAVNSTIETERMRIDSTGNVGIGTVSPASSALLDLTSTTGALLLPRMTTAQKTALTAINGMIVYDTTLNKFQGYENGAWTSFI